MCIYGEPAYPLRVHLQGPFGNPRLTPLMEAFNAPVSSVRISVEWLSGDVINYFKFLDFKENLKIGMSSIGKMCSLCMHYCTMPSPVSMAIRPRHFSSLNPPTLGILCLEVERNRTLYKTISNLPDCSCDYP